MYINSEAVRKEVEAMESCIQPKKRKHIFGKVKLIVYLCLTLITLKNQ
jgi:hypothetical protein